MKAKVILFDDWSDPQFVEFDPARAADLARQGQRILEENPNIFAVDYLLPQGFVACFEKDYEMTEDKVDIGLIRVYGDYFVLRGYTKYANTLVESNELSIKDLEAGNE